MLDSDDFGLPCRPHPVCSQPPQNSNSGSLYVHNFSFSFGVLCKHNIVKAGIFT